jgi:hypothetical protein
VRQAFDLFVSMLHETRTVMALYEYIDQTIRAPMDYSDLLRWQWVQAVSALDKFIHDIVKFGMSAIYQGLRNSTNAYRTFTIDIEIHTQMLQYPQRAVSSFEQQIQHRNSHLAFQDPKTITDALSLIWDEKHKWQAISICMNLPDEYVRTKLKNISIRRNQIVHEGDYSDVLAQRQTISQTDTIEVVDFIGKVGISIYNLVKQGV